MDEFNIDDGIGNYIGGPFRGEHDAAVEWARGYARKRNEIVYLYESGPDTALEPIAPEWTADNLDGLTICKLRDEAMDADDYATAGICGVAISPVGPDDPQVRTALHKIAEHLNSVAQAGL